MYRTAEKIQTHEEPWAGFFRLGLRTVAAHVCGHLEAPDDPEDFGVKAFGRLTREQQIGMLRTVGQAFLDPNYPEPELTQVVEATAAVIMNAFRYDLEVEADEDGCAEVRSPAPGYTDYRSTLLAILRPKWDENEDGRLPHVHSRKAAEWGELCEGIFDYVLWDEDFEDEELFVDLPPEAAAEMKRSMGVRSDYFTASAAEPSLDELKGHLAWLTNITGDTYSVKSD